MTKNEILEKYFGLLRAVEKYRDMQENPHLTKADEDLIEEFLEAYDEKIADIEDANPWIIKIKKAMECN